MYWTIGPTLVNRLSLQRKCLVRLTDGLPFDHLTAVAGVGLSPALVICGTSQVLLAGVSGGFPGVLPFRPNYRLACLDMSEIILKVTLN